MRWLKFLAIALVYLLAAGSTIALEVPRWMGCGDEGADQAGEVTRFRDASNAMHGIFGFAGLSRSSEAGHRNYDAELAGDLMAERARLWLDMIGRVNSTFHRDGDGRILSESGSAAAIVRLDNYPHGVYAYHMHHRAGRWKEHGLEDAITRAELLYQVRPAQYLLNEHYENGRFFHDIEKREFDKDSMFHGLAGMHGTVYGWVRWAKPEGAKDMGSLPQERLAAWFGITPEELVNEVARPVAERLIEAWDAELGIYGFDDDNIWPLQTLGSLLRGNKAVYESLYMFGDGENDRELAREIARQTATVLDGVFSLSREWGLPTEIRFTADGPQASSEIVDTEMLWSFVNHLGSGFAILSEGDGMSDFVASGPLQEAPAAIGEQVDKWLQFTLERGLVDGCLPESYRYSDGSIESSRHPVAAVGIFVVAAANNYRRGSAFERAAGWDDVDEAVAARSRLLYDTLLAHTLKLEALVTRG